MRITTTTICDAGIFHNAYDTGYDSALTGSVPMIADKQQNFVFLMYMQFVN